MTFREWQELMVDDPRKDYADMTLGELIREWIRLNVIDQVVRGTALTN
jgi:hypothetical protein